MIEKSCFYCKFYNPAADKSRGCKKGNNGELQKWWFNNKNKKADDPTIGEPDCFSKIEHK